MALSCNRARPRRMLAAAGLTALLLLLGSYPSSAQPLLAGAPPSATASATAPSATAVGSAAPAPKPAPPDPRVTKLNELAAKIRALLAERLAIAEDPAELFDIPLDDEEAIRVEAERLRAIVAVADAEAHAAAEMATPSGSSTPAASMAPSATAAPSSRTAPSRSAAPSSSAAVSSSAAPTGSAAIPNADAEKYRALRALDPALWHARVDLDRARLGFYQLPNDRRAALLASHATRQQAAEGGQTDKQLSRAEKKAENAEHDRLQALQQAKDAHTEAGRLVAEEHARLLQIAKQQAEFEVDLVKKQQELNARREQRLALERRVRMAIEQAKSGATLAGIDETYDALRAHLRVERAALSEAIAAAGGDSTVPAPGEDGLADLPVEVDRSAVTKVRSAVLAAVGELSRREASYRASRAEQLYQDVKALNDRRLEMLPYLSSDARSAVTGFGTQGLDQALAEARHVTLVLRYHLLATLRWVAVMREPDAERGTPAVAAVFVLLKWLLPIAAFVWWRRRASASLEALKQRLREAARKDRSHPVGGTRPERMLGFVRRIRGPVEWLLLVWTLVWLLPLETRHLLEVELATTVFSWTLGGALIVQSIDYLAGEKPGRHRRSMLQTAHIRLRSLRLVGRIVVTFGLILSLTSQLVGEGTIYSWVFGVCWFSAIPVALVLVKWWREVIFERVDLERRKTRVDQWVIDNREGWQSFVAAVVGGATMLASGAFRMVRTWMASFDITRRVLAYLFRRGMDKQADEHGIVEYLPLERKTYELLGPATASEKIVPSEADAQVADVVARIDRPGGGVFAIVGERGAGKTTLVRRIADQANEVDLVRCPFGGMDAFAAAFLKGVGGDEGAPLEDVASELDATDRSAGVLIDNAHRLILPMMGGMKNFDRLLAIARKNSSHLSWVFVFDEVIWRFFERMRGARPLFDDVIRIAQWSEEAIVSLITSRCRTAAITPSFAALVGGLPPDADDVDHEEALLQTEASYYRLIWDYAAGNPGVALHVWRSSLGIDPDGQPCVKIFQAPDTHELEKLPDPAVFVLRAIVQLEGAAPDDIRHATNLSASEVEDALRYGTTHLYLRKATDRYFVTWNWFRAVTRFLQRRHLLRANR